MKTDLQRYRTVLFDLDGTLMDTSEGILRSIDETIARCRLPALPESVRRGMIGPPINRSFQKLYGLNDEKTEEATACFRKLYAEKYLLSAKVYPGILTLLKRLRCDGFRIGVATYKRNDYAQRLLEESGLNALCDFTLGSDGKKQTKAQIIEICLAALDCSDPAQCVMVGDTLHDFEGARNAGTAFVGVTYGFGFSSREEITALPALAAADTAEELYRVIQNLQKETENRSK